MRLIFGLFAIIFLIAVAPGSAQAEDFEQFSENEWQGWIEETNQGGRIRLLPFIAQPGSASYWAQNDFGRYGMGITSGGNLRFGYRIIGQSQFIPPALKGRIAHLSGRSINAFDDYSIEFVRARINKVQLIVAGEVFEEHTYNNTLVSGTGAAEFTIPLDDYETINAIREGNFYLRAFYNYPLSSYSSASVRYDARLVSNSWFQAFKQIIERRRRSGFAVGPFDFTREVRNTYVRESANSGGYNSQTENFTVLLVDPTPQQERMVEDMLGFARSTATEVRQRHLAAHAAAVAANSPELAQAHTLYAQALNLPGAQNGEFQQQLLELLDGLEQADLMAFLTAGIKSSSQSASGYYRYQRNATTTTTTEAQLNFSNYVVRNAMVATAAVTLPFMQGQTYVPLESAFMANDNRIFGGGRLYGVVQPTNWAEGVGRAIDQRRWGDLEYALSRRFTRANLPTVDLNRKLISGDYLLHRAAATGNIDAVRRVLNAGGDPTRTNTYGETPIDLARSSGFTQIAELMEAREDASGRLSIVISHPDVTPGDFYIINPQEIRSVRRREIDDRTTALVIDEFPGTYQFQFRFNYTAIINHSDLWRLNFPYRQIASNGQQARIQAEGFITEYIVLRDGDSETRELELVWRGPLSGWTTNPGSEAAAASANSSQPFSFDFGS